MSSINSPHYNKLIAFLLLVILIVALLLAVFIINSRVFNTPHDTNEINTELTELISELDQITTAEEKQGREYSSVIESLSKSMTSEEKNEKYKNYEAGVFRVGLLYSTYHNDKLYSFINKDLVKFAEKHFPDQHEEDALNYPCQDPSCAKSETPNEILEIIDEIEASDMEDYYKDNYINNLLNISYYTIETPKYKAFEYYENANMIENSSDLSPSGSNVEIAIKLKNFIRKTYPETYELIIKSEKIDPANTKVIEVESGQDSSSP